MDAIPRKELPWASRWARFWYRGAPEARVGGIPVRFRLLTSSERSVAETKIRGAINMVAEVPKYRARMLRHTGGVFVFPTSPAVAQWHHLLGLLVISFDYLERDDTSVLDVATTIVHEITHGWLYALRVPHNQTTIARIEGICTSAEIAFARRFESADELVDGAGRRLTRDPTFYSREAEIERNANALRDLGFPIWIVSLLRRFARRLSSRGDG